MRALKTRPGRELPKSGGLGGTWSCGPGPAARSRGPWATRSPGPGEDASAGLTTPAPPTGRGADRTVTALYLTHYRPLVRLAALLVQDLATAEEIVQDSFVAVHAAWRRLPDAEHALSHLRRSVVDRSRSVLRQQVVVDKIAPRLAPDLPAGQGDPRETGIEVDRSAFISALWTLPAAQREVVVLRYFADLPETQIASATGISEGAVKVHAARAISSLRAELLKASD
jgi:RNA polymerase sigma-70 factor (sigma-E family)